MNGSLMWRLRHLRVLRKRASIRCGSALALSDGSRAVSVPILRASGCVSVRYCREGIQVWEGL